MRHPEFLLVPAVLTALALAGCTGTIYPEDGGTQRNQFLIQSLTLAGTTLEACDVMVEEVADEDGVPDQAWQAGFELDDGSAPNSLPRDDGTEQAHTLTVKATRSSDGQAFYKRVTITMHE